MLTSLDGYTEDEHGKFGWGAPEDPDVHRHINALASSLVTILRYNVRYDENSPRQGWEDAAREIHAAGDDILLFDDLPTEFDKEEMWDD